MEPTSEVLDINEAREADQKDLDILLSSPEFLNKAITIEDHKKYIDEIESGKNKPYPGAVVRVSNMHLALSVVRRMYREAGWPDNKNADATFYHESAHFAEALNWVENPKDVSLYIYLLRSNKESPIIDSIECRTDVKLSGKMPSGLKRNAMVQIAKAPGSVDLSLGDKKVIEVNK